MVNFECTKKTPSFLHNFSYLFTIIYVYNLRPGRLVIGEYIFLKELARYVAQVMAAHCTNDYCNSHHWRYLERVSLTPELHPLLLSIWLAATDHQVGSETSQEILK